MARTGSPWRDRPVIFGAWNSGYKRFARGSERGLWHRVFEELAKEADVEEVFLDSPIVRAHQHAAAPPQKGDQALGRSRGGLSTKIHALVEALGNWARWKLTGGQRHEVTHASDLIEGMATEAVVADKTYDADPLIESIT